MPDLSRFNAFMNQFMPMLLRQQFEEERVKRYLEKSLTEYAEFGRIRKEEQEREMANKIMLQLIESGQKGTEKLDRPLLALLMRMGDLGITHEALPAVTEEQYAEAISPFQQMGAVLTGLQEKKEYPSPDQIASAVRVYGTDKVNAWLKEFEKKKIEEEKLAVQRESQEIQEGRTELGWAELRQREKEFEEEKKGVKPSDKDKKHLDLLTKKEGIIKGQLSELGEAWKDEIDEKKKESLEKQLVEVLEQKMSLVEKMMKDSLDMEKINRIIARLKSNKSKIKAIEQYKELLKETEGLNELEYQYIKSLYIVHLIVRLPL